eukprot:GEMP01134742.1.p1 GENE.GEMP01134742.1~~GEMP01134742.1.p1  ORF type:complete len:100 (-),score=2.16 GEMP01134742.1:73-372(-)
MEGGLTMCVSPHFCLYMYVFVSHSRSSMTNQRTKNGTTQMETGRTSSPHFCVHYPPYPANVAQITSPRQFVGIHLGWANAASSIILCPPHSCAVKERGI